MKWTPIALLMVLLVPMGCSKKPGRTVLSALQLETEMKFESAMARLAKSGAIVRVQSSKNRAA